MHEIIWRFEQRSQSWTVPDGVFTLVDGSAAIVAVGDTALAIWHDRAVPLSPSKPASCDIDHPYPRVTWLPRAEHGPTRLGTEPTRNNRSRDAGSTELVLCDAQGNEAPLTKGPVLVGRHPACRLRIDDTRASAIHCLFVHERGGTRVVDLNSTNGTWVNGARVNSMVLRTRAVVEVGGTRLLLRPVVHSPRQIPLTSPAMKRLYDLVARVAPTDVPVLIQGESGVGKDELVKQLHEMSGRHGPLVPLNAAAISPALAQSELFGHVRGAFTGADRERDGAFVAAAGGTLFLDELAELPLPTQAELLRVVEHKRVRRVGDHREVDVDVRLVAATNRDLVTLVREGKFREDLYHRICVVPLTIPPLRQRPDDLEALVHHFLAEQPRARQLSNDAWRRLRQHSWPGNIRELLNVLRRACVMTDDEQINTRDLPLPSPTRRIRSLDDFIQQKVLDVYESNEGNVSATAVQLGVHRSTVHRHLRAARRSATRRAQIGSA